MDFHVEQNRKAHRTEDYEHEQLIIRRGQEFEVTVKFNREYKPESDVVVLQFVTGLFHKPAFQFFISVTIKTIISHMKHDSQPKQRLRTRKIERKAWVLGA